MIAEEPSETSCDGLGLVQRDEVARLKRDQGGIGNELRGATREGLGNRRIVPAMKDERGHRQGRQEARNIREHRRWLAPAQNPHELPRSRKARKWPMKIFENSTCML